MTLVCVARAVRLKLKLRIDMQDYSSDFLPVRALALGLKKPHIRDDMLLVIGRHRRFTRR
jgi:hypothetical protein